ncbi:MAG TPA: HAMP domain-containing protein [Dehalococcoidia bacterium]|nr:HAMP domain-containing protein [Dehalococcoidia bacterium]
MKVGLGIRAKILIPFLALSFISLGVISSLAFRTIYEISHLTKQNSISMGQEVTRQSIAALEDLGRRLVQRRALNVANEIELFMRYHPHIDVSELKDNEELADIAVQRVGQTGYTMVYDKTGVVYFHNDPKMVGINLRKIGGEPVYFLSIVERSFLGEASGYYEWEDTEGKVRTKYMHCIPVDRTDLVVAAGTYIDEYSAPMEGLEAEIAATVLATTQYIEEQMRKAQLIFIAIFGGMILIAATVIFLLARAITRPILALTRGAEVIAKGELDYSIKADTGDEIQQLAEQFNNMARALKESYTSLEKKVEERTRQERQRAEQLRTINEVSRKISSVVNLDELLPYVGNLLRETFQYYNVNIFLTEPSSGKLVLKALCISGQKGVIPVGVPLDVDEESIVGWVAQTGEPILANNVSGDPRYRAVEALRDTRSELAVPVRIGNKVLGVLDIESTEVDAFGEADLFTAQTLADQLAVAIENARLYEETRQMAVMEERNRMAREIHDTLAQGFSGIILQLEAAEQALSSDVTAAERHLNQARNLARKSLAEARRSVWNLRPQALEQLPLFDALKQEVDRFTQSTSAQAQFKVQGDWRDLPSEVEAGLLRICQEALTNVGKHAKASEVEVNLTFNESTVELNIRDNGVGFSPRASKSSKGKRGTFGLISMRERARGLGGTFEVQSKKGKGTLVRVVIPTR